LTLKWSFSMQSHLLMIHDPVLCRQGAELYLVLAKLTQLIFVNNSKWIEMCQHINAVTQG